jgi:hypothetical protein
MSHTMCNLFHMASFSHITNLVGFGTYKRSNNFPPGYHFLNSHRPWGCLHKHFNVLRPLFARTDFPIETPLVRFDRFCVLAHIFIPFSSFSLIKIMLLGHILCRYILLGDR